MALRSLLLLLFVAMMATSIAEAQSSVGIVHVNGTLYCTANGSAGSNGNAAPVFPNATVQVACSPDVNPNPPLNATTNSNGVYLALLIPRPNATVNSIVSNCRLYVLTSLSNCNPSLPPIIGLVSNLQFVKSVPVGFFRITYLVATGFAPQAQLHY